MQPVSWRFPSENLIGVSGMRFSTIDEKRPFTLDLAKSIHNQRLIIGQSESPVGRASRRAGGDAAPHYFLLAR
jgi:hypothetical protein